MEKPLAPNWGEEGARSAEGEGLNIHFSHRPTGEGQYPVPENKDPAKRRGHYLILDTMSFGTKVPAWYDECLLLKPNPDRT